jgi:hypothetical protein
MSRAEVVAWRTSALILRKVQNVKTCYIVVVLQKLNTTGRSRLNKTVQQQGVGAHRSIWKSRSHVVLCTRCSVRRLAAVLPGILKTHLQETTHRDTRSRTDSERCVVPLHCRERGVETVTFGDVLTSAWIMG